MTIFQAMILGLVQGLTELLPVSSSAHLEIVSWLFKWNKIPESFDIALHFGTFLAIFLYFIKDWIILIKSGYNQVVKKKRTTEGKIFWYLVFATIPAGVLSLILDKISDSIFGDSMVPVAIALIIMGIVLYIVDKNSKSTTTYKKITFKQAMLIGCSQAIAAAFPGVSRSGITMTVARGLGVERESAAKYSFLLATPIVFAAVIFSLSDFVFDLAFVIGVLVSFLVGMFVIKFLMNYLKKGSYKVFAIYRILLGIFLFLMMI